MSKRITRKSQREINKNSRTIEVYTFERMTIELFVQDISRLEKTEKRSLLAKALKAASQFNALLDHRNDVIKSDDKKSLSSIDHILSDLDAKVDSLMIKFNA